MSEFRGTNDHILQSQILDSANLAWQVPEFISPRNRVAGYTPRHCILFSSYSLMNWTNSFITSGQTEYITTSYSSSVILFLSVAAETWFKEPLSSNGPFRLLTETCVSERLSSTGLFRLSGVMSQYSYTAVLLVVYPTNESENTGICRRSKTNWGY
jgi:hypothetical protein